MHNKEIPPSFIEENTKKYSELPEEKPADLKSYVVFRLGELWLAIATKFFFESFEELYIHIVPFKSDEIVKGLVNVHGELIIALDIRHWIEETKSSEKISSAGPRFLQLGRGSSRFILVADEVKGTIEIESAKIEKLPSAIVDSDENIFKQRFMYSNKFVYIIDEEKMFLRIAEKFKE